jgi:hypothetical protein
MTIKGYHCEERSDEAISISIEPALIRAER